MGKGIHSFSYNKREYHLVIKGSNGTEEKNIEK